MGTARPASVDASAPVSRVTSVRALLRLVYLAWRRGRVDQMPLMAAGVAFYAFLSLFPALVAFEFFYAFFADPATVVTDVRALTSVMPQAARDVLSNQLIALSGQPRPVLGFGIVVAVLLEFWSASSMIGNMMGAVNTAYHLPEDRGVVRRRLLAFSMTLGTIAFMVGVCVLVVIAPRAIYGLVGDSWARWVLEVVRWGLVLGLVAVALPVVYQSFGVFGGVVVLVLWLWITSTRCCSARRSTRCAARTGCLRPPGHPHTRWWSPQPRGPSGRETNRLSPRADERCRATS